MNIQNIIAKATANASEKIAVGKNGNFESVARKQAEALISDIETAVSVFNQIEKSDVRAIIEKHNATEVLDVPKIAQIYVASVVSENLSILFNGEENAIRERNKTVVKEDGLRVTPLEQATLLCILTNDFYDGEKPNAEKFIWVDCLLYCAHLPAHIIPPSKSQISGVVSSLVKKGLIGTDGEALCFTPRGAEIVQEIAG